MAKSLVYTSRSINKKNLSSSFMKPSIASQPAAIGHERCTSVGHRIRLLWKWSHLSRKARHLNSSEMLHNAVHKRATFRNWARDFVTRVGLGPPAWPGCGIQTAGSVFFLSEGCPTPLFLLVQAMDPFGENPNRSNTPERYAGWNPPAKPYN